MPGELEHITLQIPLLFDGISNQPPAVRFRNHVERADNTIFSVADGASKRPGTEFIASITTLPDSGASGASDLPSGQFDTLVPSGGEAACSCVPGDYASSYSLAYSLDIKTPDPVACTNTNADKSGVTLTQISGQCSWLGTIPSTTTPKGNYSGRIIMSLTTEPHCQWFVAFLLVNSTVRPIAEIPEARFVVSKGGASPTGSFAGNLDQGSCLIPTWEFALDSVVIS